MTIIQNLPNVAFSENAPDLIIGGYLGEAVQISAILHGAALFSDTTFYTDSKFRITINTRQLARNLPPQAAPDYPWAQSLPTLNISITAGDQQEKISCSIIPGGIDPKITDIPEWMVHNFLTWQPQIIETTPEQPQQLYLVGSKDINRIIYTKLYTKDGLSFIKKIGDPGSNAVFLYRYNVGYSDLWEAFCKEKGVSPLCYDVYGTDGDGSTMFPQMPYAQRYILREQRYNDVCFGFINTLGGFDTLMMQGQITLKPDGENITFVTNDLETELTNGYTSYWEASTGYIDSGRMASQYQDFLKSPKRWIYKDGNWLKIIVDEYKVEDSSLELNDYTFKYHLAEKNERRYFNRETLLEPALPTKIFKE